MSAKTNGKAATSALTFYDLLIEALKFRLLSTPFTHFRYTRPAVVIVMHLYVREARRRVESSGYRWSLAVASS